MMRTGSPPRLGTQRNEARATLGDYIAECGSELGFSFYPWQELLSDTSMELIPRREPQENQSALRLNAQYVGALVGRQSGKTAWSVARVVAQCLLPARRDIAERVGLSFIGSQHVAYTAQSRTVAVEKWSEHVDIIEASDYSRHIRKVIHSTGRECCFFTNGSYYKPVTPNRTGARGSTLDLAIVDEALAHPLWLLGALRPTMAQRDGAALSIGAQFVVISNAGDEDSELLNRIQELGIESLSNPEARRVWLEWSMKPEADPLSEQTWLETMPTAGVPNGIDLEFLRTEAETMRLEQFMREYLCHRVAKSREQLIPNDRWMEQYRIDITVPADLVLALDVSPDRQRASLVAAGAVGSYLPLEVIDGRALEGCIVPYGQVAEIVEMTPDGLVKYREQFLPGSLEYQSQGIQRRGNGAFIWLNLDHQSDFDSKIGHCVNMRSEKDGAYASFKLYGGNDLAKVKSMLRESHTGLSVNFADRRAPKVIDGVVSRVQVILDSVAATPTPAYAGAGITMMRSFTGDVDLGTPELDKVRQMLADLKGKS